LDVTKAKEVVVVGGAVVVEVVVVVVVVVVVDVVVHTNPPALASASVQPVGTVLQVQYPVSGPTVIGTTEQQLGRVSPVSGDGAIVISNVTMRQMPVQLLPVPSPHLGTPHDSAHNPSVA
jgi:hypothetical protein